MKKQGIALLLLLSALLSGIAHAATAGTPPANCPTITVTNPTGTVYQAGGITPSDYDQTFTQTGGAAPVSFSLHSGTLPPGFTLFSDGRLLKQGNSTGGAFTFRVMVTDANGCTGIGPEITLINAPLDEPDLGAMIGLRDDCGWGSAFAWSQNSNPCPNNTTDINWNGVTCLSVNGQYRTGILIAACIGIKLNGTPSPAPYLSQLTALQSLDLRSCYTQTRAASEFVFLDTFSQIRRLRLDGNTGLGGTLADIFPGGFDATRFPNIAGSSNGAAYFSNTQLGGPLPAGLFTFGAGNFRFHQAQFSGALPTTGSSVPSELWLNGNRLEGTVPDVLRNAPLNKIIYLRYNMLDVDNTPPGNIDQIDPQWRSTQTVPPTNIQVTPNGPNSATLSWMPIAYQADGGYYEVLSATAPGGPYTSRGTTADKTATGLTVSGLPGGTNYFVVRSFTPAHTGDATFLANNLGNNPNDLTSKNSGEVSANVEEEPFCPGEVLNISQPTHSQSGADTSWTVPSGGPYKVKITAKGGKGGNGWCCGNPPNSALGGSGAVTVGEFILSSNQIIEAIAGAPGVDDSGGSGGGGGSGAQIQTGNVLMIAGGGGGGGNTGNGSPGIINPIGNGQGGQMGSDFGGGSGGGGLFSPGTNGGGAGFNAVGGNGQGFGDPGGGGFGGGGGGGNGGGGGGGYSGGNGGVGFSGGSGGSSINLGANQNNTAGANNAGGQVIIECLGEATFTATFAATQPLCANPTQGSLSIDLTGDNEGNTSGLEYAIVAGNTFSGSPTFSSITADPFHIASGFGTTGDADGETYTVRIRLKYNPDIFLDHTYTLTSPTTTRTWTGALSTDWHTAENWNPACVPTADNHVIIPDVTNDPLISAAAVAKSVHVQTGGALSIESAGSLTINGFFNEGFSETSGFRNQGTVANSGQLILGSTGDIGDFGLWNQGSFHNNSGGEISIDRASNTGLYNDESGSFTNAANIAIGATDGMSNFGLVNLATLNNIGGEISIDRASRMGLYNYSGTFTNTAKITIGAEASVGTHGIWNQSTFDNNSGGEIRVDRTSRHGVRHISGVFTNAAKIIIGALADVGFSGIQSEAAFHNNSGGEISIDRTSNTGLNSNWGTFTNAAKITIGANNSVGNYGLHNQTTFQNNACAELYLYAPLLNESSFTNNGLFSSSTTGAHTNSDTLTNNGIIAYPLGNPIPNVTNNEIIVAPATADGCETVSPAFGLGSPVDFTILGVFTDAAATLSAGSYTVGTNTFTAAPVLSEGAHDLFVKIQDDSSGCTRIVPWQLTTQNCCDAPAAFCKPATVSLNAAGQATIAVADVDDGSTADCGLLSIAVSPTAVNCADLGPVTVTLTVTDSNNVSSQCMTTVTVQDTTPPTITCPNPVTVTCSSQAPAVNLAAVSASDNCGAPIKSHVGDATTNMTCANRKTVTRTYRATDGSGNSATCSQVITVFDNVAPNFTSVPANVTVQCNSVPAVGNPSASDGCGGSVSIAYDGQTVSNVLCTDKYTLTRKWIATDACGNTKTATQRITVTDTQKPAFVNPPANITVQCDAIPAPATPTATDNCAATVAITYNGETRTNGTCPNRYTLTRRWTAEDNCGNTVSVSQRITVVDTGKPVFTTFPENTTIACDETPPAVGTPMATDGCGSATVTYLGQTTANNQCPGTYQIRRTWRATDACGNSTVATQTIQVTDNGAPEFVTVPADVTIQCGQSLPPLVNPTASDACGGFVSITFLGNVPSGSGCAQDYTVTRTWRAQDLCGNTALATQVITVQGNNYQEEDAEDRAEATRLTTASRLPSMTLQPNPTTDRIWLDLSDFAGEAVTVSIFSKLGQLVWENRIPAVEDLKLSVSLREAGAAAGIYTVSVRRTERGFCINCVKAKIGLAHTRFGSFTVKVVPLSTWDCFTKILPLWYCSTMRLDNDSPSPQPRVLVE